MAFDSCLVACVVCTAMVELTRLLDEVAKVISRVSDVVLNPDWLVD